MAQQDTGMGWSAKSDWLVQVAGNIAQIRIASGGSMYPGQPIPVLSNPSAADVVASGIHVLTYTHPRYHWTQEIYATANNTAFVYVANSGSSVYCAAITDSPSTIISYVSVLSGSPTLNTVVTSNAISGTNLYYAGFGPAFDPPPDTVIPSDIPVFSGNVSQTINTAASYITVGNVPISKDSAGYAVGCIAKWKTSAGVVITTPILISSVSEYTDMTTTATGYNLGKLNMLRDGIRFYMAFWDITDEPTITSALPVFDYTGPDHGPLTLENVFKFIASTSYADIRISHSPDPYEEEGAGSGEEGGDGDDLEDDGMGITHHAIPAAINTGFCRIYCPNEQQLRDLSTFLWSSQFDLTAVKKLFANPMDSVLGLSAVPINLSGASMRLYLGGVDTEMSFPMVSYQSYQVPMGAITVEKRWGSYLDYDPYTKFSIFLPFIGFKDLSADDIMGKQIILDYDVDILSGACTARLQAGGNVLYQWSGQCSIQLPVTASNWNQVFQGATSAALSAGLAVATGTAGPVLAGALAAEGVQAIMGKPRIERGGTASGAAGWMGGLTPYLVRVTPEAIIPADQNKFIGYPAFSSISLGSLTGYNEISSIHLEGIPATGAELDELEAILKGGVIF